MLRLLVQPNTFELFDHQETQNPYIDATVTISKKKVNSQYESLKNSLKNVIEFRATDSQLSDIVFVASGGVCLPRIPRTIILPNMKYSHRKKELPYIKKFLSQAKLKMIEYPSNTIPFEGQAEIKWFHGGMIGICGYGWRSTKKTTTVLKGVMDRVYGENGLIPPFLIPVKLISQDFYHLDLALLDFHDKKCIVHREAFSLKSIKMLKELLGEENVSIIDTTDTFCLNAVVDGKNLIVHEVSAKDRKFLEDTTGLKVKEIDVSEFEKSGGSVRCMVLDVY